MRPDRRAFSRLPHGLILVGSWVVVTPSSPSSVSLAPMGAVTAAAAMQRRARRHILSVGTTPVLRPAFSSCCAAIPA